jgi:molybdate transport system ATP-binding protein
LSELPHLSLELKHRLGSLEIDIAFALTHPWTVLFGPSGSGKSSTLRAIAGLLRPRDAKIALRSDSLNQTVNDTAKGIFVPPHKRAVRWCAQRPALFPNMTVRQNLQIAGEASSIAARTTDAALERFRLTGLAEAMPATLSGGEQQRVALARAALASNGRLLLLDEPFSGLDVPLRDGLLASLRDWLAEYETPVLSVTHDIEEAFLLDAEVIRIREGRITRQGPVAEVLADERSRLLQRLGRQES